jgi:hypothetical protein
MRGPISGTASDSARNGYYRTYCRLDGSNRAFKRISTVSTGISANGTIYKINIWQKYLTTSASANPAPPAPGTLSAPGTDFCISFISFVNSLSLSISVAITGTPTLAEVSVGDPSSLTCRIANTAVSEPFSDLSLSPNPFSKDLTISGSFEKDEIVNLEIRNMQGQLVAQPWVNKSLPAGNFTENLELGNFSSGIYFYSLRSTTRRNTGKIVKMD